MKWHLDGRQMGKTENLVWWVRQGSRIASFPGWSRVIVVPTVVDAKNLREKYALDDAQVLTARVWIAARAGAHPVEIAIDDVDLILTQLFGPIVRATATAESRQEANG